MSSSPSPTYASDDPVICHWDSCNLAFATLPELASHLSEDHIGWKKPSYTCEWEGCSRKSMQQQSRFALIAHLRSHTGEKPYDCPRPECEKSFSRTDALVKHLRVQHNEDLKPPPGPGNPSKDSGGGPLGSSGPNQGVITTFRHTSLPSLTSATKTPLDTRHHSTSSSLPHHNHRTHRPTHSPAPPRKQQQQRPPSIISDDRPTTPLSTTGGVVKPKSRRHTSSSLQRALKPAPARHHQRRPHEMDINPPRAPSDVGTPPSSSASDDPMQPLTPAFHAKYAVAKAKLSYISREHEMLLEEYAQVRKKLRRLRTEKDLLLEAVIAHLDQEEEGGGGDGERDRGDRGGRKRGRSRGGKGNGRRKAVRSSYEDVEYGEGDEENMMMDGDEGMGMEEEEEENLEYGYP